MKMSINGNPSQGTYPKHGFLISGEGMICHLEITHDCNFLNIESDMYEGSASIDIEALPEVISCLQAIYEERSRGLNK